MRRSEWILPFVILATLTTSSANAGIFIEPTLGVDYGMIQQDLDNSSTPGKETGNSTLMTGRAGFRTGFTFGPAFAGLTGGLGMGTLSDDKSTSTNAAIHWNMGLVAGLELGSFRFWAQYSPFDQIKSKGYALDATTLKLVDATFKGYSLGGGIGYRIAPLVSLNFEVTSASYGSSVINGATTTYPVTASGTTMSKPSMLNFALSVSMPFSVPLL